MTSFLMLDNWTEHSFETSGNTITIKATYNIAPAACPNCSCVANLYKWSVKEQSFVDSPVRGCAVRILVKRQRYRCRDCEATFFQPLPDMDEKRRMTHRGREYIEQQSLPLTFAFVAANMGIDPKTVRLVFDDYEERRKAQRTFQVPEILGIDEVYILRKPRLVLGNVGDRKPIDLLKDREKATLAVWLTNLPDRAKIKVATMDMHRPYRDVVRQMLPHAVVVVDKFHVVATANRSLDAVRRHLAKELPAKQVVGMKRRAWLMRRRPHTLTVQQSLSLEVMLGGAPDLLQQAYAAKEGFFRIYDAGTRSDAEGLYDEWLKTLPVGVAPFFAPLTTADTNWHSEIFQYFDNTATNAYVEGLNRSIKEKIGNGRGYKFEVIRAKVLSAEYVSLPIEPRVRPVRVRPEIDMTPKIVKGMAILKSLKKSLLPLRAELIHRYGTICQSCRGEYPDAKMQIHQGKIVNTKFWLLCEDCHNRFNADPETYENGDSTHYSG